MNNMKLEVEAMEMRIWKRIEKKNRTDRISNEEVLQRVDPKRQLVNLIRSRPSCKMDRSCE